MPKYLVEVVEAHISFIEVKAESESDAAKAVLQDGEGVEVRLEYDHTISDDCNDLYVHELAMNREESKKINLDRIDKLNEYLLKTYGGTHTFDILDWDMQYPFALFIETLEGYIRWEWEYVPTPDQFEKKYQKDRPENHGLVADSVI